MNGGYNSLHMGQMAHASMIGAQGPMYGGGQTMGESAFAGGASALGSVAGPAAGLGLAAMGMDPISMGARAAWGARGAGMMGAGAAGLAAAAPMAIGMMGAQYAGTQMMTGMQQQQQFNQMMRANYGHLGGPGGQGMDTSTLGGMGQTMRQMAFNVGPQGQMTNFDELGRLASNMGRMGMTQGLRDAREFSEKFKQMVSTLKEVSQHLGTSLEEAQRMMGSMKQSGVFGMGTQAAVLKTLAGTSRATGLATSEISGMMGAGSQIARMTGGRGRHGAMAGLQAANILGTATRTGILTEEDVYDVTGLTGAQGRQAMAANMMQTSARFLKGGLGRRAVAAMMGEGGGLNEEAVEEFMTGGVGTGRTMQLAHQNLAKVGRAGFLRNEGRTRAQIMARFGGLAPAAIMRGWMQQRGMDVDDDRTMLFMQRRMGLGRDEADQMMKLVRELPRIMQTRAHMGQRAEEEAGVDRAMREQQSRTGLHGLKRKFEGARARVQRTLQQVGADIMESGSDMVDRYINRITRQYVDRYERDAMSLYEAAVAGGPQGDIIGQNYFGIGAGKSDAISKFGKAQGHIFGQGVSGSSLGMEQDRFREAGFGYIAGAGNRGQMRTRIDQLRRMETQILTGGRGATRGDDFRKMGAERADEFKMALATGRIFGSGRARVTAFGSVLHRISNEDPRYEELSRRFATARPEEKAAIMANVLGGAGALQGEHQMFRAPDMLGLVGGAQFTTERERWVAIGQAFRQGPEASARTRQITQRERMSGGVLGFVGEMLGDVFGGGAEDAAVGRYLESSAGRDLALGGLGGSEAQRQTVRAQLQERAATLQRKGEAITRDETAELQVAQGILFAQDVKKFTNPDGSVNQAALSEYARRNNRTSEQVLAAVRTVGGVALQGRNRRMRQVARTISAQAGRAVQGLRLVGALEPGVGGGGLRLAEDFSEQLGGIGHRSAQGRTDAQIFVQSMVDLQLAQSQMSGDVGAEDVDRGLMESAQTAYGRGEEALGRMGVAERRALAKSMRGKGMALQRARIMRGVTLEEAMTKAGGSGLKRFGALSVMARSLGADVSKGDFQKMFMKGGEFQLGGDADAAEAILNKMGVTPELLAKSPGMQEQMKAIVQASRTGGPAGPEADRTAVQLQEEFMKAHGGAINRERIRQQDPVKADMAEHLATIAKGIGDLPKAIEGAIKGVKITVVNKDAEKKDDE